MNTITLDGVELVITPRGLDKIWGFRREIRVPLAHVRGATADTGVADEPRGLRSPGLALPGKYVGTFKKEGESSYWNVSDRRRNVVIDFNDEEFARAILTVKNPAEIQRAVNAAIQDVR